MVKAVVDTNVFISGLLNKEGIPRKIFLAFKEGQFTLFTSPPILTEILTSLNKPKICRLVDSDDRRELFLFLETFASFVFPKEEISICRDHEDNIILECASSGQVDFIVTGDKDLLALSPFRGISIVTPSDFLRYL